MIKKLINILGPLALIIICINAFYIFPASDDYLYLEKQNNYGFWKFQKWHYFYWGGRYFPNMILGSFDYHGDGLLLYRLIASFIILGLYFSMLLFVKNVIKPKEVLFSTNIIFLTYCFSIYSFSQEFYWLPGSITYTLSVILSLLSWSILEKSNKILFLITNVLLVLVLNGTNEIAMLFYNGSLVLYLLFMFFKTKKINIYILLVSLISMSCMLFSILAPGNSVRTLSEQNPNTHNFMFSLSRAVYRTFFFASERLFIFAIMGVILQQELKQKNLKINIRFIPISIVKFLCVMFPFIILCLGVFPSYYATGRIPPERTVNIIAFFMCISVIFCFKFFNDNFRRSENERTYRFSNLFPLLLVVIITIYPNELRSNIYDLFSGRSNQFAIEMTAREEYLKSTTDQVVEVKKISVLPNTLLTKDISSDPNNSFNYYYARFFKKKMVVVKDQ